MIHIAPHAFRHLHRLRELRIELNRDLIELKTFALSNIEYIERISLISNSIRVLHAEVFRNTHFVDIIDLTDNPLEVSNTDVLMISRRKHHSKKRKF